MPVRIVPFALVAAVALAGCSDGNDSPGPSDVGSVDTGDTGDAQGDAADSSTTAACDPERRPIVFVHGFLGAGDNWANQVQRFASNGYCLDALAVFDWNSLDQGADHVADLDAFVLATLEATGAAQVDLAGHSAGGRLGYEYLGDAERAGRVANYAHVASFVDEAPAGPSGAAVPTLNLWSADDTVIEEKGDIPGAVNVHVDGLDHLEVATAAVSFEAMYRHFNAGTAPATTSILAEDEIVLSGKALALGENTPAAGATVEIWPLDATTGERAEEAPAGTFSVAADGSWGPFAAEPGTHYELRVAGTGQDDRPVHYYREPFTRSNPLVYLRVLPGPGSAAGLLLSQVPFEDGQAVLVAFIANRALIEGRDSLTIDGTEMATPDFAAADDTTIAIFFYDGNENGESDYTAISTFAALPFPFLTGVDVFLDATEPAAIEVVYNGRTLRSRNWPSGTEGATIVVLD